MASLTMIEVSLSTNQWPGNNAGHQMNYSGKAEIKFGIAFDEGEVNVDLGNMAGSLADISKTIIGPMMTQGENEVLKARGILILPPTPTPPEPKGKPTLLKKS